MKIPRKTKKKIIKTFGIGSYKFIIMGVLTIEHYHKNRGSVSRLTDYGRRMNGTGFFCHPNAFHPHITFPTIYN